MKGINCKLSKLRFVQVNLHSNEGTTCSYEADTPYEMVARPLPLLVFFQSSVANHHILEPGNLNFANNQIFYLLKLL